MGLFNNIMRGFTSILAACIMIISLSACDSSTGTAVVTKPMTTTVATTAAQESKQEVMVWVSTKGGKRYHRKATCSGMEDPRCVTIKEAKQEGFTPCGNCYK